MQNSGQITNYLQNDLKAIGVEILKSQMNFSRKILYT